MPSSTIRKVCVITGARSEYGLLKHLMKAIRESKSFDLQVVVTGSHLSEKYGNTCQEIESDGFSIDAKVDIHLVGDSPADISESTSRSVSGFSKCFDYLKPDLVVVLGDRYEILGVAIAALIQRIPIAHLHGGEVTEGAMDEGIRHAITKFSHIHFVAAEEYRRRVIQLGESPDRVFCVGGLGVDAIRRIEMIPRATLEAELGFRFRERNLLVTFHPVTLEENSSSRQMQELLMALSDLDDAQLIFTLPNADTDNRVLFDLIEKFVEEKPNACAFPSLGQRRYFSCLAQVDAVVGNSSSGLLEVPSFGKATLNIGDRQKGRLKATSVIDCDPDHLSIKRALQTMYSDDFKKTLSTVLNPYGSGGAVERIIGHLEAISFDNMLKKRFYDLPLQCFV